MWENMRGIIAPSLNAYSYHLMQIQKLCGGNTPTGGEAFRGLTSKPATVEGSDVVWDRQS